MVKREKRYRETNAADCLLRVEFVVGEFQDNRIRFELVPTRSMGHTNPSLSHGSRTVHTDPGAHETFRNLIHKESLERYEAKP